MSLNLTTPLDGALRVARIYVVGVDNVILDADWSPWQRDLAQTAFEILRMSIVSHQLHVRYSAYKSINIRVVKMKTIFSYCIFVQLV